MLMKIFLKKKFLLTWKKFFEKFFESKKIFKKKFFYSAWERNFFRSNTKLHAMVANDVSGSQHVTSEHEKRYGVRCVASLTPSPTCEAKNAQPLGAARPRNEAPCVRTNFFLRRKKNFSLTRWRHSFAGETLRGGWELAHRC